MRKYCFFLLCFGMLTGMLSSCSDDDKDPVLFPPTVSIFNPGEKVSMLQGDGLVLKARLKSAIPSTLQWTVNGKASSTDSVYTFVATEMGRFNIVLTAKNADGEASDTLAVEVLDKLFSIESRIKHWTGEGENRSVLAIQWVTGDHFEEPADDEVHFLAWGYRWKSGKEATGSEMLVNIAKNDPRLYVILAEQWGGIAVKGLIYDGNNDGKIELKNATLHLTQANFVDGVYRQTEGEDIDGFKMTDTADFWLGGWNAAYTTYWLGGPRAIVPDADDFEYAQGMASGRVLENNSWDVWTMSSINGDMVNVSPIPRLIQAAEANKK